MDDILQESGFLIFPTDFTTLTDFSPRDSVPAQTFMHDLEQLSRMQPASSSEANRVATDHLSSMLNGPFSLPRSLEIRRGLQTSSDNKENIAVYIWQKLGLFTGFNCLQKFNPQPSNEVQVTFLKLKMSFSTNWRTDRSLLSSARY